METKNRATCSSAPRRLTPPQRLGASAAILVVASGILQAACGLVQDAPTVPALSGGIQVNEPDHDAWAAAIAGSGLDAVQVTVYARQQAWDSADLIVPESADGVVAEIRAAKRAGLGVTLVLRVALEQGMASNRHYWHGMIWPHADDIEAWFANYRDFALWGAALAAAEDVDLLAVGSELNSLTSTLPVDEIPNLYAYFLDPVRTAGVRERLVECAASIPPEDLADDLRFPDGGGYDTLEAYLRAQEAADRAWTRRLATGDLPEAAPADEGLGAAATTFDLDGLNARRGVYEAHWRRLIAEVRGVYRGPVGYAANFDQVTEVGFWDDLDVIGVNAYYPLSLRGLSGDRLDEALTASWGAIAVELNALGSRSGGPGRVLPVVFFELGWTRKAASTVRPFSYHRVEVLETAPPPGSSSGTSLTCVHWATQAEEPRERVAAIGALERVVAQGGFPTLRGFTLWKLTTDPRHRALEPFAVQLPSPGTGADPADSAFIETAARLAERLRISASGGR